MMGRSKERKGRGVLERGEGGGAVGRGEEEKKVALRRNSLPLFPIRSGSKVLETEDILHTHLDFGALSNTPKS